MIINGAKPKEPFFSKSESVRECWAGKIGKKRTVPFSNMRFFLFSHRMIIATVNSSHRMTRTGNNRMTRINEPCSFSNRKASLKSRQGWQYYRRRSNKNPKTAQWWWNNMGLYLKLLNKLAQHYTTLFCKR